MEEQVILVDKDDNQTGIAGKLEAHELGLLHRAFSVFIFNRQGALLLQQRALEKYHSPGMWTNTCCSHPKPEEDIKTAAHRRLKEEMGMECPLAYAFNFTYQASFSNGLIENEYDHVFFGISNNLPEPNAEEVAAFKYVDLKDLELSLQTHPEDYSAWLKICFNKIIDYKTHNNELDN